MGHSDSTIRIFISSPGDVAEERALAERVIERLKGRFAGRLGLEPIFWEHEPLLATASFQDQIVCPSDTDIVVCILWARLGTRLPPHVTRPDGSRYASGTEYEFEEAARGYREHGKPSLMVYRKTADPRVSLQDEDALLEKLAQKKLDQFVEKWFHREDGSLNAAFSPYEDLAEFEENLERHLGKLIERLLPDLEAGEAAPSTPPLWTQGSPYRGLKAFEFEHAPVFFGRTRAVHDVLDALRAQAADRRAFVTVLGMSGGGKSSLARAGVLPLLVQPGVIEGIGLWRRAVMRPADAGGDLFASLAAALLGEEALPELAEGGTDPQELAALLRETPQAVVPLLKVGLAQAASAMVTARGLLQQPGTRLVVLVDQMEELFTQESVDHAERTAFVATLNALARSGRVWVLTTMRSDFYPRCAELPALMALQEGTGQVHLRPPTPAEIGQIIRQPSAAAGLRFGHDPETGEGLDEVLRDAAASNQASLPLLEFALEELYKERSEQGVLTFKAYRTLGGVEGALAQRAEEVFASLTPEVQATLPSVLRALVRVGQGEGDAVSRKRAPYTAASSASKILVDAFVEARLFATELDADGEAIVSVSHEALLRHWPRLTRWLDEDREDLHILGRVVAASDRWQAENRSPDFLLQRGKPLGEAQGLLARWQADLSPETVAFIEASAARGRRRVQVRRGMVAALGVLAVVAGFSALLTNQARNDAELRQGQAENLIGYMLGDLRDKLAPVGRLEILKDVGDKAQEYFASLDVKDLTEEELARQAQALRQIGDVQMDQGNLEGALVSFRQAMVLNQSLTAKDPRNAERQFDLAQSHFWIGAVHYYQDALDSARVAFQAYYHIARQQVDAQPKDTRWLLELSSAHTNLGAVLEEQNDLDAALEQIRQAVTINERLVALDSTRSDWRYELAGGYNWLGRVLHRRGDRAEALEPRRRALALFENLLIEDPEHTGWKEYLASTHNNLALTHQLLAEADAALEHYGAAQDLFRQLVTHDPANADWQAGLAESRHGTGSALRQRGEWADALAQLRQALAIRQRLVDQDPTHLSLRRDLALLHIDIGRALEEQGRLDAAFEAVKQAVDLHEQLHEEDPEDWASGFGLTYALVRWGRVQRQRGREAEAQAAWIRTIALCETLARQADEEAVLARWAEAALLLGRIEEARPLVEKLAAQGYENPAFWALSQQHHLTEGIEGG